MAPEQIEGQEADARTDIFAFGAVLYEMLTGKRAFEGKSQATLIGSIMSSQPAPLSAVAPATPPPSIAWCAPASPRIRNDRYQSAHDVLLLLQSVNDVSAACRHRFHACATRRGSGRGHRRRWRGLGCARRVL